MNTEKIIKETKMIMVTALILGVILLGSGIAFSLLEIKFIDNNKAFTGLSFIPFSVAFATYFKLNRIRKSPQKMRKILISESDERLVSLKNEADAKAFRITQAAVFLAYMGYTLMVPEHIFESVGWWLLLIILFITFLSQGILQVMTMRRSRTDESES